MSAHQILLILAVVFFVAAAIPTVVERFNAIAIGLALFAAAGLVS